MRQALVVGISTFDTADAYAATTAESVKREALWGEPCGGLAIFTKNAKMRRSSSTLGC
jgi:aryl-alcohol dehydrogenase-like predicted oxidoreductase